jgi:hypothetical protein
MIGRVSAWGAVVAGMVLAAGLTVSGAADASVPSGTRELKVELIMTREAGSDDDGLADSLSLVFTDKQ